MRWNPRSARVDWRCRFRKPARSAGSTPKKKRTRCRVRFVFEGWRVAYQPTAGFAFVCFVICFSSSHTVRPVFTCTSDIWNE